MDMVLGLLSHLNGHTHGHTTERGFVIGLYRGGILTFDLRISKR
jgi:hypothetical protein